MTTTNDLTPLLKRLKLGTLLPTLPERLALARRDQLDYAAFLEVLLADEVSRRDQGRLERQVLLAGFEEVCRLEDFDWTAGITLDRRLLDAAFSLDFLRRHEHVLFVGPVGVGKTFLAQALGYAAIRAGSSVRFMQADKCFLALAQARVDHTLEKTFRSLLAPDLLILDDLGLSLRERALLRLMHALNICPDAIGRVVPSCLANPAYARAHPDIHHIT